MDPVDQLTMAVQAAQALRTAEDPEAVLDGVWGHDITDLWIEGLMYYPEQRLIYALMGS